MRTREEPIIAERECPICYRTWELEVTRVERVTVRRRSTCPDCQLRETRKSGIAKSFRRLVTMSAPRPEWFDEGLCLQVDPDLFFPEKGGQAKPAKMVCRGCPVRNACLAWALKTRQMDGIWGATTPRERAELLRKGRQA